jgi:integrase
MIQTPIMGRRPRGTGTIFVKGSRWYAQFRLPGHERPVKRSLGRVASMSEAQANRRALKLLNELGSAPPPTDRQTIEGIAPAFLDHVEHVRLRQRATVIDYELTLRLHLVPYFAGRKLDRITPEDLTGYIRAKHGVLSPKTVANHVTLLGGLYRFAIRRGAATRNPIELIDRPRQQGASSDVKFFTVEEVEKLLRHVLAGTFAATDSALILSGSMLGLRQGELVALRWRDVDWLAGVVRVRRKYAHGEFSQPKSRRSSRAVPMADRVAAALDAHHQASAWQGDDDLVFCHPDLGTVLDVSALRKRYKAAVKAAGLRPLPFHSLRHRYGTAMAGAGAPLRSLMEWMGHSNIQTTMIYADYLHDPSQGAELAQRAFARASQRASNTDELKATP